MNAGTLLDRIGADTQLLLRAVLGSSQVATDSFQEWRARVDLDELENPSVRLLPLLARRIDGIAPDDPLRARIRGIYRHAWVKNQLLVRDAARVARALRDRGIPVIVLKGAALMRHFGDDWGLRPMYDVDLLVAPHDVARTVQVLRDIGCTPIPDVSTEWITRRLIERRHGIAFSGEIEGQLDLHWHVLNRSLARHADTQFWAAATPFSLADVQVLALAPIDLLLHVLTHGARSTTGGHVQWVVDATHILRSDELPGDASRLAHLARAHDVVGIVRATLEAVERLIDEPRAGRLRAELGSARSTLSERGASSPRVPAPAQRLGRALSKHGGGRTRVFERARSLVRTSLDLELVASPLSYVLYATTGHRPSFAQRMHRRHGSIGHTVAPPPTYSLGTELDLTDPSICEQVAGPGWPRLDALGPRTAGAEARIVLEIDQPVCSDLELCVEMTRGAQSEDGIASPTVVVRVNETTVGRVELPLSKDWERFHMIVPRHAVNRFRPVEIAFVVHQGIVGAVRDAYSARLRSLTLHRTGGNHVVVNDADAASEGLLSSRSGERAPLRPRPRRARAPLPRDRPQPLAQLRMMAPLARPLDRIPVPVRRLGRILIPRTLRRRIHRRLAPQPWQPRFTWTPPTPRDDLVTAPPDFIGLGMGRSGTTWWWRLLNRHPRVYNLDGLHKERHFLRVQYLWDPPLPHDAARYAAWFPRPPGMLAGEWTPWYLAHPWIGHAIATLAPDARLLVILRDPVERFVSGMTHDLPKSIRNPGSVQFQFYCGLYAAMLGWLEPYVDRDHLLVLQLERCILDPEGELRRTFEFLGLEPHIEPDTRLPVNTARRTKLELDPERRGALVKAYESDVAELVGRYPEIDRGLWPNFA